MSGPSRRLAIVGIAVLAAAAAGWGGLGSRDATGAATGEPASARADSASADRPGEHADATAGTAMSASRAASAPASIEAVSTGTARVADAATPLPGTPTAGMPPVVRSAPPALAATPPPPSLPVVMRSSPTADGAAAVRPTVALPPGMRAEDVEVSPSGVVSVLRSGDDARLRASASTPADYGAAAVPGRPTTVTRTP